MGQDSLSKEVILLEIRRCAAENGGVAVGRERFYALTGIRQSAWLGRYWVSWGEALQEAGFAPNQLQGAIDEDVLLGALAALTRDLGHFPTDPEMRMRKRLDPSFPSHGVFRRLGNRAEQRERVRLYCASSPDYSDVLSLVGTSDAAVGEITSPGKVTPHVSSEGVVYLLRVGKHYKIGRSLNFGRRSREINLQLPERAERVHAIRTDDPAGIERYWHDRFAGRRANGEWFLLTQADVAAFKRWKRI